MTSTGRVADLLEKGEDFCLATVIRSGSATVPLAAKAVCFPDGRVELFGLPPDREKPLAALVAKAFACGKSGCVDLEPGAEVFLEVRVGAARLIICGAGHIAVSLAKFSLEAGFFPTVLDDRPEYASDARFPGCRVLAQEFGAALRRTDLGPLRYCVVITRGHSHDLDCLREIMKWETDYVGLIGSRARIGVVKNCLVKEGFSREMLDDRLFSPIGLAIGAESPEEIALCIAAELVSVRRLGRVQTRELRKPGWGAS
ncbi:MAG: XdhC family protein [Elusimicrobia bacterium]|nr:XdhC family protein [Elusimicrobiota bacterium]